MKLTLTAATLNVAKLSLKMHLFYIKDKAELYGNTLFTLRNEKEICRHTT